MDCVHSLSTQTTKLVIYPIAFHRDSPHFTSPNYPTLGSSVDIRPACLHAQQHVSPTPPLRECWVRLAHKPCHRSAHTAAPFGHKVPIGTYPTSLSPLPRYAFLAFIGDSIDLNFAYSHIPYALCPLTPQWPNLLFYWQEVRRNIAELERRLKSTGSSIHHVASADPSRRLSGAASRFAQPMQAPNARPAGPSLRSSGRFAISSTVRRTSGSSSVGDC